MSAQHSTVAKAASGLSSARRTLEGVPGGHAEGFLQQAAPRGDNPVSVPSCATSKCCESHVATAKSSSAGIQKTYVFTRPRSLARICSPPDTQTSGAGKWLA